jgi:hypothetical protein
MAGVALASRNHVTGELLHHVQSRRVAFDTVEHEYRRQPFRVARPPDGRPPASGEARCEACGRAVTYKVLSARATARRRGCWLVVALTGMAAFVVSWVLLFGGDLDGFPVIGIGLGAGATIAGFIFRHIEDGVRVGRQRGPNKHYVRSGRMSTAGRA